MSYSTIYKIRTDLSLQNRVEACAADEGADSPNNVMHQVMWPIATADDVIAAYESALAADNPDPGGDPGVVTDGMILGIVQANWPETP